MIISRTPLRISFFSGGSDLPSFYTKEPGAALSITIDKYIHIFAHAVPFTDIRLMYDTIEEVSDLNNMQHDITRETLKYFGVNKQITIGSISDIISRGSGLGSSSAFTVGLINAIINQRQSWESLHPIKLAEYACMIEMDKCKFPVGKQDQYVATYGGLNSYDFQKNKWIFN